MRAWEGAMTEGVDEYLRMTRIAQPSRFFLLADSYTSTTGGQWYAIQFGGNHGLHLRHSGRANAFFADGHVAAMEADYFRSLPMEEPGFNPRAFHLFDLNGKKL